MDGWEVESDPPSDNNSAAATEHGPPPAADLQQLQLVVAPSGARGLGDGGRRQRGRPKGLPGNPSQRRVLKTRAAEVAALRAHETRSSKQRASFPFAAQHVFIVSLCMLHD